MGSRDLNSVPHPHNVLRAPLPPSCSATPRGKIHTRLLVTQTSHQPFIGTHQTIIRCPLIPSKQSLSAHHGRGKAANCKQKVPSSSLPGSLQERTQAWGPLSSRVTPGAQGSESQGVQGAGIADQPSRSGPHPLPQPSGLSLIWLGPPWESLSLATLSNLHPKCIGLPTTWSPHGHSTEGASALSRRCWRG